MAPEDMMFARLQSPAPRLTSITPLLAGLAIVAVQLSGVGLAAAGVVIKGDAEALRLDVDKAPISEVLSALSAFDIRYRAEVPLDQNLDGSYRGSLARVISRILDGYSYVVRRDDAGTEIVIFAAKTERSASPDLPPMQARRRQRPRNPDDD